MTFFPNLPIPIPNFPTHTATPLYLVLDGSQIQNLEKTLLSQGIQIQVICPTPLLPLRAVSPFIVELTSKSLAWFIEYDKANQGYIVQSALDARELAEKLQDYYQVITPYGSEVFFKIGQPEMLFVLLSNLQIPLWQYLDTVWLPTRMGWKTLSKDKEVTQFDALKKDGYHLSEKQWQLIEETSQLNNMEAIHQYLAVHHTNYFQSLKNPYEFIDATIREINQIGLHETSDLACYFNVLVMMKEGGISENKYSEMMLLIKTPSEKTPPQRLEAAWELAKKELSL